MYKIVLFKSAVDTTGVPLETFDDSPVGLSHVLTALAEIDEGKPKDPRSTPGYRLAHARGVERNDANMIGKSWLTLDIDGDEDEESLQEIFAGYIVVAQRSKSGKGWHLHLPMPECLTKPRYEEVLQSVTRVWKGFDATGSRWGQFFFVGSGPSNIWNQDGATFAAAGTEVWSECLEQGVPDFCYVKREPKRYRWGVDSRDNERVSLAGWLAHSVTDGKATEESVRGFWERHFANRGYTLQPTDSGPAKMVSKTLQFSKRDLEEARGSGTGPFGAPGEGESNGKRKRATGNSAAAIRNGLVSTWLKEIESRVFFYGGYSTFIDRVTGAIGKKDAFRNIFMRVFNPGTSERPFDLLTQAIAEGFVQRVDTLGVFDRGDDPHWVVDVGGEWVVNRSPRLGPVLEPVDGWRVHPKFDRWVGGFDPVIRAWLGHIIAAPHQKPDTIVILHGPTGEGKSSVVESLLLRLLEVPKGYRGNDVIGESQVVTVAFERLVEKFNSGYVTKLVVGVSEAPVETNMSAPRWQRAENARRWDLVKQLITDKNVLAERKGFEPEMVGSVARYIFTSESLMDESGLVAMAGNRRLLTQFVSSGLSLDVHGTREMFEHIAQYPEYYRWVMAQWWHEADQGTRDKALCGTGGLIDGESVVESGLGASFVIRLSRAIIRGLEGGSGVFFNPVIEGGKRIPYQEIAVAADVKEVNGRPCISSRAFLMAANAWLNAELKTNRITKFYRTLHVCDGDGKERTAGGKLRYFPCTVEEYARWARENTMPSLDSMDWAELAME
jgi:hypothetical protein